MRLADVESRAFAVRALKRMLKTVKTAPLPEWNDGMIGLLDNRLGFRDPATGQKLYGLVYVLIAEDEQSISERTRAILGTRGD